ncbi:MAG: efflux RND transporter periplasmic adaptor subunit [Chthoniobacteraceae bacterium]|nr:efflux RND transporter periplasmic adaptor subunit [Chthoniobacteraceae bacterium]
MKKPFLPALLAVLCAALFLGGCGRKSAVPTFETAPVQTGDITQYVTATGTLNAVVSVDVGSQISGRIQALNADFNSLVKKGEVIAEIDTSLYQAAVDQAKGDLESARAALDLAQIKVDRERALIERKAGPQSDLDTAEAEYRQAKATLDIKKALLAQANANLDHCRIEAPVDGIVITRKVDVGQTVAAAMTTPVLYTIAKDIRQMRIITNVSEADIGQVKNGQTAEFTVDAFPDEVFNGKISQVRLSGTCTDNVVTYQTVVDVANPEQKLFPNMTAQVSILVAQRRGILTVPNAALRFAPLEGTKFENADVASLKVARGQRVVYLPGKAPGTLRAVLVKVGITNGMDSEILDGLKKGDAVVTASTASGAKSGGPPPPI